MLVDFFIFLRVLPFEMTDFSYVLILFRSSWIRSFLNSLIIHYIERGINGYRSSVHL